MKFNTPYEYIGRSGSTFTDISQTVPDMSLSVREILDRFTRGLPTDVVEPHYSDTDSFDDIPVNLPPDFDLTDIDEARRQAQFWQQTAEEEAQQAAERARAARDGVVADTPSQAD